jgi:GTPase Era involved in 16S rRNA processing
MSNVDLMREIADLAGIDSYDPSTESQSTRYSRFNKEERQEIYEEITRESGEEFLRKELPSAIMKEIGTELHSNFEDEFARDDLKEIYLELSDDGDCSDG